MIKKLLIALFAFAVTAQAAEKEWTGSWNLAGHQFSGAALRKPLPVFSAVLAPMGSLAAKRSDDCAQCFDKFKMARFKANRDAAAATALTVVGGTLMTVGFTGPERFFSQYRDVNEVGLAIRRILITGTVVTLVSAAAAWFVVKNFQENRYLEGLDKK